MNSIFVFITSLIVLMSSCDDQQSRAQLPVVVPDRSLIVSDREETKMFAKFGFHPKHLVHVGAHKGQEAEEYNDYGIKNVTWIEADPSLIPALKEHVDKYHHRVIEALCSSVSGQKVDFNISSNGEGESSSLLKPGENLKNFPGVGFNRKIELTTTTLNQLEQDNQLSFMDALVLDVQGAELLVLNGMSEKMLSGIDIIFLEISRIELYQGQALFPEIDRWLNQREFTCIAGCDNNEVHTNAVFVKKYFVAQ